MRYLYVRLERERTGTRVTIKLPKAMDAMEVYEWMRGNGWAEWDILETLEKEPAE